MLLIFIGLLAAYLIGAIPFGLLIGFLKGKDIRKEGSGNIGATNLARVLGGFHWFVFAFVLDSAKGIIAPLIYTLIIKDALTADTETLKFLIEKPAYVLVGYGLFAILGHMFPIYLKFKGGKGVATASGVVVFLAAKPTAICLIVFLFVFLVSRLVSLSSILTSIALVIAYIMLNIETAFNDNLAVTLFCFVVMILVIIKHKGNIYRIFKGTEPRVNFRRKKKSDNSQSKSD